MGSCPPGKFGNNSNRMCIPCESPCELCFGGSKNCTSCSGSHFLKDNTCLSICPDGFWPDIISHLCRKCAAPCSKCNNSATECTSCSTDTYLLGKSCLNACPKGFWDDNIEKTCKPCTYKCATCYGIIQKLESIFFNNINICNLTKFKKGSSSNCLSCNEANYLHDNTCVENCPSGYWEDRTERFARDVKVSVLPVFSILQPAPHAIIQDSCLNFAV